MENPLGIAVIGAGYWGGNYVRLFSELPETQVIAVCDQRPECLEKVRRRFPGVTLTSSVDELLALPGIDAVVVCTHADSHYVITKQCIEAGKHILIEKPMTTSVDDAQHLIELAQQHRVTLMVGHIYLYNTGINKIKGYVDEGTLGQLYYLYSQRTNLGPIRYDVNALWDLAPHDVSIMNYLMNRSPEWVTAVGHSALGNSREDVGFIVLGYPNNVVANIHVSWVDPDKVRQTVVVGSERRVVFNDLNPQEPVRIFEKGIVSSQPVPSNFGEQFAIRNGDIISPSVGLSEPLKEQGLHFVDCILHGKQPRSDGQNGLDVVRVMSAITTSMKHKGMPIELTVEERNGNHKEAVADFVR
ncbi:MAG: Gfo/Idh/MocA family oxidoreductase [Chloroflexota bacterium]